MKKCKHMPLNCEVHRMINCGNSHANAALSRLRPILPGALLMMSFTDDLDPSVAQSRRCGYRLARTVRLLAQST